MDSSGRCSRSGLASARSPVAWVRRVTGVRGGRVGVRSCFLFSASAASGGGFRHRPLEEWHRAGEPLSAPSVALDGILGLGRFDDRAALVARRPQQLLEERLGHAIDVVPRVDHATDRRCRRSRRPGRRVEARAPRPRRARGLVRPRRCLPGQVHQLAQQIFGAIRVSPRAAEADSCESATSRSTSVIRAARTWYSTLTGQYLVRRRRLCATGERLDRGPRGPGNQPLNHRPDRARRPRDRVRQPPTRRPTEVLHSARRCL